MQLSQKQKRFLDFFCIFEMDIKFGTFSKKDDPHSLCTLEFKDSDKRD